jgi:hypothetical protein
MAIEKPGREVGYLRHAGLRGTALYTSDTAVFDDDDLVEQRVCSCKNFLCKELGGHNQRLGLEAPKKRKTQSRSKYYLIIMSNLVKSPARSDERNFALRILLVVGSIVKFFAGRKIDAAEVGTVENCVPEVAVMHFAFRQVRLRKIGIMDLAIAENRFVQLLSFKNGVVENAVFESGCKCKVFGLREIDAGEFCS